MAARSTSRGFFASLFDFSFNSFVTVSLVKVLYVLGMVVAAGYALAILFTIGSAGVGWLLFALLLAPVVFLLMVVYFRVLLEVLVVIFRIGENIAVIASNTGGGGIAPTGSTAAPAPPPPSPPSDPPPPPAP